jgi:hypothetical protein
VSPRAKKKKKKTYILNYKLHKIDRVPITGKRLLLLEWQKEVNTGRYLEGLNHKSLTV